MQREGRGSKVAIDIYFADLLRNWYLFEILNTSPTGKNFVKKDVSKDLCDGEHQLILEMKKRHKVSCVKILLFCYLIRKLAFI